MAGWERGPGGEGLDEVKIYDRALSAEEILAAAQAGGL
ncbi:MAG: LamG domain-containing protein [bacterium]|nr:LamG domain-containing protein [bacterium]